MCCKGLVHDFCRHIITVSQVPQQRQHLHTLSHNSFIFKSLNGRINPSCLVLFKKHSQNTVSNNLFSPHEKNEQENNNKAFKAVISSH